jgi:hypothetical protein
MVLTFACATAIVGFAWLALAMKAHWQQVMAASVLLE